MTQLARGFAYALLLTAAAVRPAVAQFSTVYNVPPDAAPASIGSDTQLNLSDGGVLPDGFAAGASDGSSTNVEVNIDGGTVGSGFLAYSGAQVQVTGGVFSDLSAVAGEIRIGGGTSPGGVVGAFLGGYVEVFGGEIPGGGLATGSSMIRVTGGVVGELQAFNDFQGSPSLEVAGGLVSGDVRSNGGGAIAVTGGTIDGTLIASFSNPNLGPDTLEVSGGSIANLAIIDAIANLTGTQFVLDGIDITGSLPIGEPFEVDAVGLPLSGVLADGSAFAFDFGGEDDLVTEFATLTLTRIQESLLGDYNGDDVVDAADYTVWRDNLELPVEAPGDGADGNRSGVVDAGDYDVWRDNYGRTVAATPAPAADTIPEPSALLLALAAAATALASRRIRQITYPR